MLSMTHVFTILLMQEAVYKPKQYGG